MQQQQPLPQSQKRPRAFIGVVPIGLVWGIDGTEWSLCLNAGCTKRTKFGGITRPLVPTAFQVLNKNTEHYYQDK